MLDVSTLFLLCALVGVIAGLGAAGFHYLLQLANHLFLDGLAGYRPQAPLGEKALFHETLSHFSRWILFILPAAGGLISGLIVFWLAPEAEGHGTDAAIEAYHHRNGYIRTRVPFVKTIASAITMGTGGSAGREGPIAQIGAGLGSALAHWLGLSVKQRRIIMAAGLGAGIGAIFRAPLAGALFAAEVLYREMDLEYEVIGPAVLSSIIAFSTFGSIFGWSPLFETPNFRFNSPLELGPYLILALVVAFGGRIYPQIFYGIRDFFRRLSIPNWLKPALGGLIVGCVGLFAPSALATGFGVVQNAFLGQATATFLLIVAGTKVLTTSFTVGSGGSGGVFGPAVVIGGSLGGAVGIVFHNLWPTLVPAPGAFAMVGMAGFFASAAHVPISTIIMVSEMTGNYQLLVPTMFVSLLGFLLVRQHTLYEKQLPTRAASPIHQRLILRAMLERTTVAELLAMHKTAPPATVRDDAPLSVVLERFAQSGYTSLPVLNENDSLVGAIPFQSVRHILENRSTLSQIIVAKDMADNPATATPDQTLFDALREMGKRQHGDLLVVAKNDPKRKVLGILTSNDINSIYDEQFVDTREPIAKTPLSIIRNLLKRMHIPGFISSK
ncbi:MAG: chloride channel protein [Deltaproteobacteria bacterium]|nr:chloride channel protein [Deltaproteobacteria bacterium]